jgi:hypothetical protein
MTSMQPLWWFALPVLLLPLWWHLQKRERTHTEPLATARFLPTAAPRQQRVPRLLDVPLLLARLLLLAALIAWLAVLALPWKRDTVFIDPSLAADAWTEQQIRAAGMDQAAREPLPSDLWNWLARNEHAWHPSARFLVVARALPMPALPPRLAHPVTLRVPTSSAAAVVPARAAPPVARHIVVVATPEQMPRWRALFAAFGTAAENAYRYVLSDTPTAATELIVWDLPDAKPPADWQAPLWWRTDAIGAPAAPAARPSVLFTGVDTKQGLVWSAPQWPLSDAAGARSLYEIWQRESRPYAAYPLPAIQNLPAQRKAPLSATLASSLEWLAAAMLALFVLERMLAHVRRR